MSDAPTATVILAVYNARATIDACVDSLLALRYPADRLELRIVDNGSTDGTAAALERYGERIVLEHERKRGASAARNAGLAGARGEVVAFTDADCVVDPDWLARLVGGLRDPQVGIAGGAILACDPANPVQRYGETIHDHRKSIEVFRPPYAMTGNWASPRELLLRLGGFDERFLRGQDVDLSYRIVQAGYALAFVPDAIVRHHNESSMAGLMREGFTHGFHSVLARKRHERFLHELGHRRVDRGAYARIGARLLEWGRGRDDPQALYDAAFNAAKKVGKLLGSVRYGHVDL